MDKSAQPVYTCTEIPNGFRIDRYYQMVYLGTWISPPPSERYVVVITVVTIVINCNARLDSRLRLNKGRNVSVSLFCPRKDGILYIHSS